MILLASLRVMARIDASFCHSARRGLSITTRRALLLRYAPAPGRNFMPGHGASAFAYLLSLALLALIRPADAADPTVIGVNAFPNAKALPLHAGIAKGI